MMSQVSGFREWNTDDGDFVIQYDEVEETFTVYSGDSANGYTNVLTFLRGGPEHKVLTDALDH